jgi:glycine cleavage system aminomethyltransferase T
MHGDSNPPLISIGPRVRKSPFFDATRRHGAKAFTVYNHMYMPTMYSDVVTEYWSLVNDVTLWDVSCQRQVEISGPDAFELIQLLTPRDMSRCKVGQCQYMVLTDADGGVINDAVMLRVGEEQFWLSPGDGDVLLWVLGVAARSGFDAKVFEPDVSPLQLQGPKSPYVARKLFGDKILDLKYYWLMETSLDDIPLVISRTGWSGELGYELYLRDAQYGDQLWERVMEAGNEFDIAPTAPNLIRSIEGGLLSYCSDITRADNPFLFGFDYFVDFNQPGEFIGKDALQEIQNDGVRRKLVGVEFDGEPLPEPNSQFYPVCDGDQEIGHVTRCVHSPRLKKNIGFANVPIEYAEIGIKLTFRWPSGDFETTVCEWPWFPAQKKIPEDL